MKHKRNYAAPSIDIVTATLNGGLLIGSKPETVTKDFTVKTGDYEVEGNNWSNSSIVFD